jgi:arylsulfatase A
MRVPLIARWKGRAASGRVNGDLIDSTDFLPTICEAAGVSTASMGTIDGRSFLPQLLGKSGKPREWIYSWYDPRPGHDKERWTQTTRFIFDQRWKLYEDGRMFDWASDPGENKPAENAAARSKLKKVLDRYREEESRVRR